MLPPNPLQRGKRSRGRVRVREGGGDNYTSRPCPLIPTSYSAALAHSIIYVCVVHPEGVPTPEHRGTITHVCMYYSSYCRLLTDPYDYTDE